MIALIRSRIAAGLVAGTIAGLFLSGAAQAITDNFFRYSEPKTGSYSIHPAALAPYSNGAMYSNLQGFLVSGTPHCYQTGVNLPQGAKITVLRVWYGTGNADGLAFFLRRHQLSTGAEAILVAETSTDTSHGRVAESYTVSGASATVNNNANMYEFLVCFSSLTDTFFTGARLTYTYTTAGD